MDPIKGTKTLIFVGIEWKDRKNHPSVGDCKTTGNAVSDFYKTNSRNLLKIKSEGVTMKVPLNGNKKNVNDAEKLAMDKYKGYDYYSVASFFTHNHAGKNMAHLSGTQISTACHENGHLLGLGHAGSYKTINGKTEYDDYGDRTSVMSRYPSKYITAPQYYHLGWLPKNEYVFITDDDLKKPIKYTLKSLYDFESEGLSTIIYKQHEGKPAFISFVRYMAKLYIALHLSKGGGSQLIKLFGNEFIDIQFTKLHIKVIKLTGDQAIITVSKINETSNLENRLLTMLGSDIPLEDEDNNIMEVEEAEDIYDINEVDNKKEKM